MEQSEIRIEELKSQIKESQAELKQIYQAAGERAVNERLFKGDNELVQTQLQKVGELDSRLNSIDGQMDDLRSSYNRISEISDREKEIGEEYSRLEKDNRKLFIPLGHGAYDKLKGENGGEYSKSVNALIEMESRISELESEIFRLDSSGVKKGLFNGIKGKSRILILKSKKKRNESSMEALYGKLGEKIYKKDISFFDSLKGETISEFLANRKRMEKYDEEMAGLKEENARLEKHLKSEFNSSRQKKTEEKLQSERDLALSDKMSGLYDLGIFLHKEKISLDDKEIGDFFSAADNISKAIEGLNEEIERCKAELEIEKLDEEISDMKKNIKELEMTIEKCNSDISEFNKEIKRARAEIRKLKKVTEADAEEKQN